MWWVYTWLSEKDCSHEAVMTMGGARNEETMSRMLGEKEEEFFRSCVFFSRVTESLFSEMGGVSATMSGVSTGVVVTSVPSSSADTATAVGTFSASWIRRATTCRTLSRHVETRVSVALAAHVTSSSRTYLSPTTAHKGSTLERRDSKSASCSMRHEAYAAASPKPSNSIASS